MLASLFAVTWSPELRGILVVVIGATVLCGGVYLILATNLGARLGFLVALAGLFGWIATMGAIWWVYGIGLKGRDPVWLPAEPVTVVRDGNLVAAGISNTGDILDEGWVLLPESDPGRGQAAASADEMLQREFELFNAGEYVVLNVYDKGGERWPKINDSLDFLAFRHDPHYALVEVAPTVRAISEPGRAPLPPEIDESQPNTFVLMLRDLGTKRQPAAFITIGSTIVFLVLCLILSRRDRLVAEHLQQAGELEKVG
jgi:hypothetical protein